MATLRGTRHLTVLTGGEPFESQCYYGQGLVVWWHRLSARP